MAEIDAPDFKRDARTIFGCMADETEVSDRLEVPLWTEKEWKEFSERSTAQVAAPKPRKL